MSPADPLNELVHELIEDEVLDLIFAEHRKAKMARRVCSHCGQQCRNFAPPYTDLFAAGHIGDPNASLPAELVKCDMCEKSMGASTFARHLERCMGLPGARSGNRSRSTKSYAENDTAAPDKKRKKAPKKSKSASSLADTAALPSTSLPTPDMGPTSLATSDLPLAMPATVTATSTPEPDAKPKRPPAKRRKTKAADPPAPAPAPVAIPAGTTVAGKTLPGKTVPGKSVPGKSAPTTVVGKTVPVTVAGKSVPVAVAGKTLPATTIAGKTVPATTIAGKTVPATTIAGKTVPGKTVPPKMVAGKSVPGIAGKVLPAAVAKRKGGGGGAGSGGFQRIPPAAASDGYLHSGGYDYED